MANVDIAVIEIAPLAGSTNAGVKLGFVSGGTKAAQNDTWTLTNAKSIAWAVLTTDADGVSDPVTIATNIITLTSATASSASGFILYT